MPSRHRIIAALIQRSIAGGEFSPGMSLSPNTELAQRLGASAEELRLALARLESDGLIVLSDNLTATVSRVPTLTQVMSVPADLQKAATHAQREVPCSGKTGRRHGRPSI